MRYVVNPKDGCIEKSQDTQQPAHVPAVAAAAMAAVAAAAAKNVLFPNRAERERERRKEEEDAATALARASGGWPDGRQDPEDPLGIEMRGAGEDYGDVEHLDVDPLQGLSQHDEFLAAQARMDAEDAVYDEFEPAAGVPGSRVLGM